MKKLLIIFTLMLMSLSISAQKYHDAAAFGLNGHVKECSVDDIVGDIYANYKHIEFDKEGRLLSLDNNQITNIKRTPDGYLTSFKIVSPYSFEYNNKHKVIKIENNEFKSFFSYDNNGILNKMSWADQTFNTASVTTFTIRTNTFDKHKNYLGFNVFNYKGENTVSSKRTITYWSDNQKVNTSRASGTVSSNTPAKTQQTAKPSSSSKQTSTPKQGSAVSSTSSTKSYSKCPDNNHPHAIDLGLPSGTKWACCNVDATTPEDYGGYYAWGEKEEKAQYNWNTYTHCNGSKETCHNIGSTINGTLYDVAHVKWGGFWSLPSNEQFKELVDKCTSQWTTRNGVLGRLFTSSNGGSIFLPAAGYKMDNGLVNKDKYGCYWSANQNNYYEYKSNGDVLTFNSKETLLNTSCLRYDGIPVRPVFK